MFWRFGGYSNISTIDTLLEKQNVKLEDLLEESDLVQEVKSHNPKLIEFLRDDKTLRSLLMYVVAPGPEVNEEEQDLEDEEPKGDEEKDKAEKQRLKFSYTACEILSCEAWSIIESLMANPQYLTEFWDFMRRPTPLDPLQAGYFTKVNEALLEKKTEDMLEFFKSLPDIIPAMLQHVDCPMVMDLLLKIISLEKAEGGVGIVDWLHDQNLVPTLLSHLSPDCNSSTQTSAGDFLKAIITISANAAQNEQSCIGPNSLTRQLVSGPCVEQLISSMLKGGNPLTVGVGIVIEVIRKNNSDYDPEGQSPDAPPTNHDPIFLGTLLRRFAEHVPDFMSLILSPQRAVTDGEHTKIVQRGTLKSAWGTQIEPLGFDRFKTCELMAELLHCSNMGLLNEKGSEEYIKARDAERERLRAAGAFSGSKQTEDSIAETSNSSSRFETGFTPSASNSFEELRVANGIEEDGFEKITVPGMDGTKQDLSESATQQSDGFIDEPLSSSLQTNQVEEANIPTQNLDDNVRKLSVEDLEMTSPPEELDTATQSHPSAKRDELSPYPEDKPAPLFSRSKDPHKTPTPSSPTEPSSPKATTDIRDESGLSMQVEGDTSMQNRDEIMQESMFSTDDDKPVVGDYLKTMFVENQVVPTILSFFFRFPWNNFLHNVVYDVVQQVFNGPMDRGHNRFLAFDLFETGKVTQQIIDGQKRSDEAQNKKSMRLGYMGHLTLVAEEVVKFGERHPKEILSPTVQDCIYGKDWEEYVTKTLAETRERDNAILGGFRPESGLGPRQAVLNAVNAGGFMGSNALANAGLTGGQQGLDTVDLSNNGSATSAGYNSGSSLLSGFGSSSDDEDEEMEEGDDSDRRTMMQLSTADTGPAVEGSDQPVPLIPPPPAPLNIEPSRARRRLADRLAMHKAQQQAAEQEQAATEFGLETDDPFAALGDHDDQDAEDPFSLDEEEQDITAFGKRTNANDFGPSSDKGTFSVSRGISNLFSAGHRAHGSNDEFEDSMDGSSSGSGSDIDSEHPPLEARTSLERRPLDVDDDEEMGEMVAPTDEANSSDEEILSAAEKERLGIRAGDDDDGGSEFSGQDDYDHDDDGEALVEIAMPRTGKQRSKNSI